MDKAIKEQLELIKEYTQELKNTKSDKRKRDLKKCIRRLNNELNEYRRINKKR